MKNPLDFRIFNKLIERFSVSISWNKNRKILMYSNHFYFHCLFIIIIKKINKAIHHVKFLCYKYQISDFLK